MNRGFAVTATVRKSDPRGTLAELIRDLPYGGQLYIFTISSGQSRGGHWHKRKTEWFTCIAGHATLVLEADEGTAAPVEIALPGDFSSVVHVQPGTRHTFTSQEGATIVACISESFDATDPDTFFPPPK